MSKTEEEPSFPKVSGSNLEGKRFDLPRDFEKELNIVIVAFRREQTALVEAWVRSLEDIENKSPDVRFYELPVLGKAHFPFRWWIDGGMRAGIADSKTRERTITLYTMKSGFKSQLLIPNEETIYIFLVNKSGKILWYTKGEFTEGKKQELQHVLEDNK